MAERTGKPVVLLTGSSGLIGTKITEALVPSFDVVGLDVEKPDKEIAGSSWLSCDLTDDTSVSRAMDEVHKRFGNRITSVVHLAAYYSFSGEDSPLYRTITIGGTQRLLDRLHTFEVEQFIFSSTLLLMQPGEPGETIDEGSPLQADWDYPKSKIAAEWAIYEGRGNIPAVILRMAGVYDENCHSIPLSHHIQRIYEKRLESYMFPGDPTHGQPYIHMDDVVSCVQRTIQVRNQLDPEEVFLIAEPDIMSHEELQETLGQLLHGKEWPTYRIPPVMAKAGAWIKEKLLGQDMFIKPWMVDLADEHYPVIIQKANRKLDWYPRHRLRDTLPQMVESLKADPQAWYRENGLTPPEEEGSSKKQEG